MDNETSLGQQLLTFLKERSMLNYGQLIPVSLVHSAIGIKCPDLGTRKGFEELALLELGAVDYVRSFLIGQGMYLGKAKTNYRILLPSENARQAQSYMASADRKLLRARKLTKNTPTIPAKLATTQDVRIMMKRENIATEQRHRLAMM